MDAHDVPSRLCCYPFSKPPPLPLPSPLLATLPVSSRPPCPFPSPPVPPVPSRLLPSPLSLPVSSRPPCPFPRKVAHDGEQWPVDAHDLPSLLLSVLMPTYPCPAEERVGAWGDGGKWVCMLPTAIQENPIVYSVGSNEQYDFEQAIGAALHTKPFTFDPFLSPNASQRMHALPFLHFHEIAVAGAASLEDFRAKNPGITFMTLQGAMEKLGHSYVDVLKMDCEGCEEEFIMGLKRETDAFLERRRAEGGVWTEDEKAGKRRGRGDAKLVVNGGNLPFGQLQVEFHYMHKPQQSLPYLYAMEGMGYRMFHVEPNPLCYSCIEVAFVHEDLVFPPLSLDCGSLLRRSEVSEYVARGGDRSPQPHPKPIVPHVAGASFEA
ncbi:unnamed protein product [Closterium sp. Yama58-4]|nr:unnamed protein product [Closterium sp. Yama58-4]